MQTVKKSSYRQRVYQDPSSKEVALVYGDDVAPEGKVLLADHDVSEMITVQDHVDPTLIPRPDQNDANNEAPSSPLLGGGGEAIPIPEGI